MKPAFGDEVKTPRKVFTDWIDNNPAKSILLYTVVVASGTWAVSKFILEENRVNLVLAQVETEKAIAEQYRAKLEVTQAEVETLRAENKEYLDWLKQMPDSVQVMVPRIAELRKELSESQRRAEVSSIGFHAEASHTAGLAKYSPSSRFDVRPGVAYVDPKTGLSVSVAEVYSDKAVDGIINFPSGESTTFSAEKAGKQWFFSADSKPYKLQIMEVDFLTDTVTFAVTEDSRPQSDRARKR